MSPRQRPKSETLLILQKRLENLGKKLASPPHHQAEKWILSATILDGILDQVTSFGVRLRPLPPEGFDSLATSLDCAATMRMESDSHPDSPTWNQYRSLKVRMESDSNLDSTTWNWSKSRISDILTKEESKKKMTYLATFMKRCLNIGGSTNGHRKCKLEQIKKRVWRLEHSLVSSNSHSIANEIVAGLADVAVLRSLAAFRSNEEEEVCDYDASGEDNDETGNPEAATQTPTKLGLLILNVPKSLAKVCRVSKYLGRFGQIELIKVRSEKEAVSFYVNYSKKSSQKAALETLQRNPFRRAWLVHVLVIQEATETQFENQQLDQVISTLEGATKVLAGVMDHKVPFEVVKSLYSWAQPKDNMEFRQMYLNLLLVRFSTQPSIKIVDMILDLDKEQVVDDLLKAIEVFVVDKEKQIKIFAHAARVIGKNFNEIMMAKVQEVLMRLFPLEPSKYLQLMVTTAGVPDWPNLAKYLDRMMCEESNKLVLDIVTHILQVLPEMEWNKQTIMDMIVTSCFSHNPGMFVDLLVQHGSHEDGVKAVHILRQKYHEGENMMEVVKNMWNRESLRTTIIQVLLDLFDEARPLVYVKTILELTQNEAYMLRVVACIEEKTAFGSSWALSELPKILHDVCKVCQEKQYTHLSRRLVSIVVDQMEKDPNQFAYLLFTFSQSSQEISKACTSLESYMSSQASAAVQRLFPVFLYLVSQAVAKFSLAKPDVCRILPAYFSKAKLTCEQLEQLFSAAPLWKGYKTCFLQCLRSQWANIKADDKCDNWVSLCETLTTAFRGESSLLTPIRNFMQGLVKELQAKTIQANVEKTTVNYTSWKRDTICVPPCMYPTSSKDGIGRRCDGCLQLVDFLAHAQDRQRNITVNATFRKCILYLLRREVSKQTPLGNYYRTTVAEQLGVQFGELDRHENAARFRSRSCGCVLVTKTNVTATNNNNSIMPQLKANLERYKVAIQKITALSCELAASVPAEATSLPSSTATSGSPPAPKKQKHH